MARVADFVCLLIVLMDIGAGVLAIEAQLASNEFQDGWRNKKVECIIANREAFRLGLASASLFALAHISANLLGGCICFCSRDDNLSVHRKVWLTCFLFTWIIMGVAFPMLITGVLLVSSKMAVGSCSLLQYHHFLSNAGILCFLHSICCLGFHFLASYANFQLDKIDAHHSSSPDTLP